MRLHRPGLSLAATVAALGRPQSYPGGVAQVRTIETHMSWVFLTERHAYKLKKPIRTPALDHTTLAARRRACLTELTLNRRLAASVYLDVVPVTACDGGVRVEAAGRTVDWLVKMRRLPAERMLDACIARGSVMPTDIVRLADALADFYAQAEPNPEPASTYVERLATDLVAKASALCRPRYGLQRADVERVVTRAHQWLARHAELLGARAGSVVDAHGDLRPEHVCLERPPVVIDCLEFSRSLRLLDPLSELTFLALECRRLGAPWIGERLVQGYLRGTGQCVDASLLRFYEVHHALVRATIAVWHLDDDALDHDEAWRKRAAHYLRLTRLEL